ncbi:MAG: LamG domain-containing protein [Mangrovibacterium sp.]
MNQKKLTYRLFLITGFLMIAMLSQAGQTLYSELFDSIRTSIRLRVHLLVNVNDFTTGDLDSLVDRNIPLAFYDQNIDSPEYMQWLQKLSFRQNQIPVLVKSVQTKPMAESVVLITDREVDRVQLSLTPPDSLFSDSLFTFNELLYVDPGNAANPGSDLFFSLWSQSGKVPNLIPVSRSNFRGIARIAELLNSTKNIFGVVRSGEKLLGHVSWKGYPHSKTNGYFCFPLLPSKTLPFVPYKPGYRFSPDIIYDSPGNRGFLKEFKALGLSSDFGLTDHFVSGNRIMNRQRKNDQEIISSGVELIHDEKRGECVLFPGRAYLDAGTQSISTLKPNFTVTAWIKPTRLSDNNSILGKGTYFVLKLHNGLLTYTMQGIKDYFSVHSRIPVNQWTFISLVHSAYENRIRFYINGQLTDQIDLLSAYRESDHTLLIGSNLWEEFFEGAIGEIKIWQRELNEDEIYRQYLGSINGNKKPLSSLFIWLLIPVCLLLTGFLVWKQDRVFRKKKAQTPVRNNDHVHSIACEKILCFGGLRVLNREGTDISRKFSPKLKQLFVLIFLNSVNGQKGINTKKLSEILWPGMSLQDSKNTRGTNIQNLKSILSLCSGIRLVFRDKFWLIELDPTCYSDYADSLTRIDELEKLPKDVPIPVLELKALLEILKAGTPFPNMTGSWLDPYISKLSDRIIELGLIFLDRLDEKRDATLLYELAEVISLYDPLNEPALNKKLCLLTHQGKLGLARTVYDHFARLYQELYQEPYPVDFRSITLADGLKN